MNAKEQIEAVKKMASVKEVESVLDAEKEATKPRKTVINACEERIGELTTGGGDLPAEIPAPAKAKEPTKEDKRIREFKTKTQHLIPCANIEKFANEFFGKELKSAKTKDCIVTITLKSGASFTQRGN